MLTYSAPCKKLICLRILCVLFVAMLCLGACGCADGKKYDANIKISIVDSAFFTADYSATEVEYGDSASVTLHMLDGYSPVSCDFADYVLEQKSAGEYILTLNNVTRPSRVTVVSEKIQTEETFEEKTCSVEYYLNDGSGAVITQNCTFSYHIRPNTISGEGIERDGYTLLCWNTAADGSGERIGLGSRITAEDGQTLILYAEWVEWLPEEDFLYKIQSDGTAELTGYKGSGDAELFVVPGEVGGRKVASIAGSFTTNIPCGKITSPVLVLPSSLNNVRANAFINAAFSEVFFYDGLEDVGDGAFSHNVSTIHINANRPPRLQAYNYNARFADNLDLIIKNADKNKLIFFSGCSLAYGLDSYAVAEAFPGYVVVNAGLNGEFDALFQLECMLPYIKEGDVLVHAPEPMNQYQFFAAHKLDGRVFAMVEGNYDLISAADFSYTDSLFDAWNMYCSLRSTEEDGSYNDYSGLFNRYGDYTEDRPYDESTESARDVAYTEGCGFDISLLTKENIANLAAIYGRFEEKGATVYYSWAPISLQSDGNEDVTAAANEFVARLEKLLSPYGYMIISEAGDYLYKGRYFYDTDYHLNDLGVILRTEQLISDLKSIGLGI